MVQDMQNYNYCYNLKDLMFISNKSARISFISGFVLSIKELKSSLSFAKRGIVLVQRLIVPFFESNKKGTHRTVRKLHILHCNA
jgi:hypothetical protein